MKKLHEDEQDWNKIITAYVVVLDHIRDVLKQIPIDFNEDDTHTFRESIADNDKQWAVRSVNNLIEQIETLGSNDEVMTAQDFKNLAVISEYQDFHSDLDKSLKRAIRILRLCGYSVEPQTNRE